MFKNIFTKTKDSSENLGPEIDKYKNKNEGKALAENLFKLGKEASQNGKSGEAVDFYVRAKLIFQKLREKEKVDTLNYLLGLTYERMNDIEKAIEIELEIKKNINDTDEHAYVKNLERLGDLYLSKEDFQTAESNYMRAAKFLLTPQYPHDQGKLQSVIEIRIKNNLSKRYIKIGKQPQAQEQIEILLKIDPSESEKYNLMMADSYYYEGKLDQAIQIYNDAFESRYSQVNNTLVYLKEKSEFDWIRNSFDYNMRKVEAKQGLEKVCELATKLSEYHENLDLSKSIEFAEIADATSHSDVTRNRLEKLRQKLLQSKTKEATFSASQADLQKIRTEIEKNNSRIQELLRKLKNDLSTGRDVSLDNSSIDAAKELGQFGEAAIDFIFPYLEKSTDAYIALGFIGGDRTKEILLVKLKEAENEGNYRKLTAAVRGLGFFDDQEVLDALGWVNDFSKDAMASHAARMAIENIRNRKNK